MKYSVYKHSTLHKWLNLLTLPMANEFLLLLLIGFAIHVVIVGPTVQQKQNFEVQWWLFVILFIYVSVHLVTNLTNVAQFNDAQIVTKCQTLAGDNALLLIHSLWLNRVIELLYYRMHTILNKCQTLANDYVPKLLKHIF